MDQAQNRSIAKPKLPQSFRKTLPMRFSSNSMFISGSEYNLFGLGNIDSLQLLSHHCLHVFYHFPNGCQVISKHLLFRFFIICSLLMFLHAIGRCTDFLRKPVKLTPCYGIYIYMRTVEWRLYECSCPLCETSTILNESQHPSNPSSSLATT